MYVFCHLPSLLQEPPRGFLTFIHSSKSLLSNPHVYQTLHRGPVILWQKMGVASAIMGLTTFPKSPLTLHLGALLAQLCPVTHLLENFPWPFSSKIPAPRPHRGHLKPPFTPPLPPMKRPIPQQTPDFLSTLPLLTLFALCEQNQA